MTCYGHTREVKKVSFTADRNQIVSLGGEIKIWDAATGNELKEIEGIHSDFGLNPVGTQIATRDRDGKIKLFDLMTGEEIRTLLGEYPKYVTNISFSYNGKQIAGSSDNRTIRLWDSTNGKLLHTIDTKKPGASNMGVREICFSPDGKWIAVLNHISIRLFDTSDGESIKTIEFGDTFFRSECMCVSPDGRWIATGGGRNLIKLWDAATGKEVRSFKGHSDAVTCVSFNPDGQQIVSGSQDGTVKQWNVASGQEIVTRRGHTDRITSVAFSPDGSRIVSGSRDGTVKLWNPTEANNLRLIRGDEKYVRCICFSPDGKRLASGGISTAPRVWDAITGELVVAMKEPNRGSLSVAFKHDGTQIVSGEKDGTLRFWDASNGDELLAVLGHQSPVINAVFSSDDTLIVSADNNGTVKLWDAADGREIRSWENAQYSVKGVTFSPNGKQIITTMQSGEIKRWDVASGKELDSIQKVNFSAGDPCIAFSGDGMQIASGSRDTMINIYETLTGKQIITLRGHVNPVRSLSFSPDGKRIVSISGVAGSTDHTVKLWDVATGEELISLKEQSQEISNILFSPDGSMVTWAASGADPAIKLWDVAVTEEVKIVKGVGFKKPKIVTDDDGTKIVVFVGRKKTVVWESKSEDSGLESTSSVPQLVSLGKDLMLVDQSYRDAPREKAFRRFKAKLSPSFHANQATIAEQKQDWYAATFHRAWEFKGDPERPGAHYYFKKAFKELQTQYEDQERELTDFLSPQVNEVSEIKQPKPLKPQVTISKTEADSINQEIWRKVRVSNASSVKNTAAVSQTEIDLLRNVCIQYFNQREYLTTLMVAEYRLNHLQLDVMVVEVRISTMAKAFKTELEWSPVELAILAMSYHKLGNKEKATEYLTKLDKAMKLDKYRDDEDSKSFFADANELLGPMEAAKTDDK